MSGELSTPIEGSVVLVTGANRGIGLAFVHGFLAAGAKRVYAAARQVESLTQLAQNDKRIVPIQLDITDDTSVVATANELRDVQILVNNAGVISSARLIGATDLSAAEREIAVNFFGTLRMSRAFAPVLAANGGGALINILSILARATSPAVGSYSASKAAAFSMTQSIRAELRAQKTHVLAIMPGYVDTDMTNGLDVPKITAADVVEATLKALLNGDEDVYPGETAAYLAVLLQQDPKAVEQMLAKSIEA